jgi:hypothetical protein
MYANHRRIRSQARPALLWTLLFFLGSHFVMGRYLHRHHPEMFDPEVSLRLDKLPQRLKEAPGRPLALALGSSRIVLGFRPESVIEQTASDDPKFVLFNFSMLGVGPVGERMVLHRLVRKGIRPKWLFLEVWPPILTQAFPFVEEIRTESRDVYWSDVGIIARLYHHRWQAIGRVIEQTLTPLLPYRQSVLEHYAPFVLPGMTTQMCDRGFEKSLQYRLDEFGWVNYDIQDDGTYQERARRVTKPLFDRFCISPVSDRALHDLLEECRANDIQVVFLLMPDHSLVRSWYTAMQDKVMPYLRQLSIENHAPIVDARAWQPDEHIPDYCHLSPRGARSFSERFGREVYRPLVQGSPLAKEVILNTDAARP